jgi:hypothetical protein
MKRNKVKQTCPKFILCVLVHATSPYPYCKSMCTALVFWVCGFYLSLVEVLHRLTGPVGQPFASRRRGQQFAPRGCISHSYWNCEILLALSRYSLVLCPVSSCSLPARLERYYHWIRKDFRRLIKYLIRRAMKRCKKLDYIIRVKLLKQL